jgi:hypothetical protein
VGARDPQFPVEFDQQTAEYQIVHGADCRWRLTMSFCPWCGGRLPSRRADLFTQPSGREMAEVQSALATARSVEDVFQRLGPPDELYDWDDDLETAS